MLSTSTEQFQKQCFELQRRRWRWSGGCSYLVSKYAGRGVDDANQQDLKISMKQANEQFTLQKTEDGGNENGKLGVIFHKPNGQQFTEDRVQIA